MNPHDQTDQNGLKILLQQQEDLKCQQTEGKRHDSAPHVTAPSFECDNGT